jgi:hypothetical protein
MTAHSRIGGSWSTIDQIYARVGGTWKEIDTGYTKIGGVWKEFYSAVSNMEATGGTIFTGADFRYHVFSSSGTFEVTANPQDVQYLVVAGGGGAAADGTNEGGSGGGGAGGFLTGTTSTSITSYTVTVGAGGAGGGLGAQGGNSAFGAITATGGGLGSGDKTDGGAGGSGGGASGNILGASGGAGTAGQGNNGGGTQAGEGATGAGGGGGAGAAGGIGIYNVDVNQRHGGDGGDGLPSSIIGTSVYYAGGGGGAANNTFSQRGFGGLGGGGDAGVTTNGFNGTANTGGGGGGARAVLNGGSGGSGVVIIRYPYTSPVDGSNNYSVLLNSSGSDGYVDVPSVAAIENVSTLTIEAWVRRLGPGASGFPVIVAKSGITDGDYQLAYQNSTSELLFRHEFSTRQGQWAVAMPPDNTWYHVAVTFNVSDLSEPTFYINGVPYSSGFRQLAVPSGDPLYATGPLTIGSRDLGIRGFYGNIDEVRVWNVIRTAEEIQNNYNTRISPTSGLQGYWSFEVTTEDIAGNSNGSFVGDVQFAPEAPFT